MSQQITHMKHWNHLQVSSNENATEQNLWDAELINRNIQFEMHALEKAEINTLVSIHLKKLQKEVTKRIAK